MWLNTTATNCAEAFHRARGVLLQLHARSHRDSLETDLSMASGLHHKQEQRNIDAMQKAR